MLAAEASVLSDQVTGRRKSATPLVGGVAAVTTALSLAFYRAMMR